MTRYCTYIFKKGAKKGQNCKEECHLKTNFCKKHYTNTNLEPDTQQESQSNIKEKYPNIISISKLVNKKIQEETIRDKIFELPTNEINKSIIFKHYNNMKRTDPNSTEYYKNQIFVDLSLSYPWSKYYNINDNIKNQTINRSGTYNNVINNAALNTNTNSTALDVTNFNKSLFDVNAAFMAAKAGTMSKQDALKKYNDTLGKTVGYAGSLEQAESLMAANTSVVIQSIKLRAQAQVFYAKSAEAAAKSISGEAFDLSWFEQGLNMLKSGGNMVGLAVANAESAGKNFAEINKQTKAFADEGDKLTLAAIENDKKLKAGLGKPPEIKTTEAKKVETPEEKAARLKKEAQDRINANEAIKQSEDECLFEGNR